MRGDAYVVAEMLYRLEQQSAVLRPNAVEIAATLNRETNDEYPAVREASAELTRALDAFVATKETLEGHVVAHDGIGELGESLGELVLRARSMVVLAQLDRLRDALAEPVAQARSRGWFLGPRESIGEIGAFVREQLDKIHAMWTPYRPRQPQLRGMTDAERSTFYRMMVGIAQRALRELWREPELVRFLEHGLGAVDLPEVHLACQQIVSVLHLEVKPRRMRAVNGPLEQR